MSAMRSPAFSVCGEEVLAELGEDAVPQGQAGGDSGLRGCAGCFPERLVGAAEVGDHAQREWAMVFAVDFDVTFEVPDVGGEAARVLRVEVADHLAEHIGDDVFAAEGEGCGHCCEIAGADDVEGGTHEGARGDGDRGHVEWNVVDGERCGLAGEGGEEIADGSYVGACFLHGLEVKLEVADGAAFELVALFAEDDLVDEAAALGKG